MSEIVTAPSDEALPPSPENPTPEYAAFLRDALDWLRTAEPGTSLATTELATFMLARGWNRRVLALPREPSEAAVVAASQAAWDHGEWPALVHEDAMYAALRAAYAIERAATPDSQPQGG